MRGSRLAANLVVAGAGALLLAWAALADGRWFERHVLELYCTSDPRTPGREQLARALAALIAIGLVAWVRPRAVRWAGKRRLAELAGSSAAIVAAIVLALAAGDALLRRFGKPKPLLADPFLPPMRVDATLTYANLPSTSKEVMINGAPVRYAINAQGNRARRIDDEPDRSAPTVLLTGESIAIGYDLPYEKTCAGLLADALGVQVVNLAVTGVGSGPAYQRLRDALAWFEHPIATVTFVVPLQLPRNVARRGAGFIATSPLLDLVDRLVPLHSADAIPLTNAILRATARDSLAHGARPVFLMTNYGPPCLPDAEASPPLARALFENVDGKHAIVPIDPGSTTSATDLHPNEAAERRLAAAILSLLR